MKGGAAVVERDVEAVGVERSWDGELIRKLSREIFFQRRIFQGKVEIKLPSESVCFIISS